MSNIIQSTWEQMPAAISSRIEDCKSLIQGFEKAAEYIEDDDCESLDYQFENLERFVSELHRRTVGIKLFLEMRVASLKDDSQ